MANYTLHSFLSDGQSTSGGEDDFQSPTSNQSADDPNVTMRGDDTSTPVVSEDEDEPSYAKAAKPNSVSTTNDYPTY